MKRREFRIRKKHLVRVGWTIGCMTAILIYIAACAISWIVTCGVFKLVTLCFGWEYTWGIATGVWLIMYLAKQVFSMGDVRVRE